MTVLDAQDVTQTRLCRIAECPKEARNGAPLRGPWANLCDEHHAAAGAKAARERESTSRPTRNGSSSKRPPNEASFEKRAKGLVEVGRRLDRAISRYRPAKAEMDEAMGAWRAICRQLAGDEGTSE